MVATVMKRLIILQSGPKAVLGLLSPVPTLSPPSRFKVELWEKSDQLGGNLHAAGFPTFKHDVLKLIRYQSHRIA